ncbi:MAG: hypothetical protein R3Y29_04875 [bacterium]
MNINLKKLIFRGIILYCVLFSFMHFIVYKQVALGAMYYYIDNVNTSTTRENIDSIEIIYDFKIGSQYGIQIKYIDEPELNYRYTYYIRTQELKFSYAQNQNHIEVDDKSLKNEIYVHTHSEDIFTGNQHYKLRVSMPYTLRGYIYNLRVSMYDTFKDYIHNLFN